MSSLGRPAAGRGDAEHQLGLLERAAHVGGIAVVRRHADQGLAGEVVGDLARVVGVAGQQRVDLAAHGLRQRPRALARDGGEQAPGGALARVGAEADGAGAEVAAQARGAAHDVARVEVVAREQLLEEGAAKVLFGLVARFGDGDLGERGDGRDVEVLAGVGLALAEHQHGAELLAAGHDRHLGSDVRRTFGLAARQPLGDVALVRGPGLDRRAEARDDHGYGGARVGGGDLRDALEAVAREDRTDHLEVGTPRRWKRFGSGHREGQGFIENVGSGKTGRRERAPQEMRAPAGYPVERGSGPRGDLLRLMGLQDWLSILAGADANCLLHRDDEDLPVPHLARTAVLQDRLLDHADILVFHHDLELELRP